MYSNPNFTSTGAAEVKIILNEATTNRITNITGYTEVFGKRVDVITANPNSIMVSGDGFINTNRLTLIMGKSGNGVDGDTLDGNGKLNSFLISNNPNTSITIVGRNITDTAGNTIAYNLGIDTNDVNYADIISRVVEINDNIHGNVVSIKIGNNRATINDITKEFEVASKESNINKLCTSFYNLFIYPKFEIKKLRSCNF